MFRVVRILSFGLFLPLLFLPLGRCSLDSEIGEHVDHFSFSVQGMPADFNLEQFNNITIKVITFDDTPFRYGYVGWGVLILLLISFFGVNLPLILTWLKPFAWLSLPLMFISHSLYCAVILGASSITVYGHLFVYIGYVYGFASLNAYLPSSIRLR